MIRYFISFCFVLAFSSGIAQHYTSAHVFAHNDYAQKNPFHTAYALGVGYIEADVFLKDGALMVAHEPKEIEESRTLAKLYLDPMLKNVKKNKGFAYRDSRQKLTIMIDLKTEGISTLNEIVRQLKKYPQLISCPTLQFMISGNVPDPGLWQDYPDFIYFDGRPSIAYTREQLNRISMISTGFRQYSGWDGISELRSDDRDAMLKLVEDAHRKGKIFRFWATPDIPEAWKVLMELNMDVIVTDRVEDLIDFLTQQNK